MSKIYYITSTTENDFIFKELHVNKHKAEFWPYTRSSVETQLKAAEAVLQCALLNQTLKQNLRDKCIMRKNTSGTFLALALKYLCQLTQGE